MGRHVIQVTVECPRCGSPTELTYVAATSRRGLRFSSNLRCENCAVTEERDGPELSEDARRAFVVREVHWSLRIRDLGPRATEALRALAKLRSEGPSEVLRLVHEGRPIKEGARVEVEYFADVLAETDLDVVLARLDGTSLSSGSSAGIRSESTSTCSSASTEEDGWEADGVEDDETPTQV